MLRGGDTVFARLDSKTGENRNLPISIEKCSSIFIFFGQLHSDGDFESIDPKICAVGDYLVNGTAKGAILACFW
jgi:hypothetical protein